MGCKVDFSGIRTVRIPKEQFDAIDSKAVSILLTCKEDGRVLGFDRRNEESGCEDNIMPLFDKMWEQDKNFRHDIDCLLVFMINQNIGNIAVTMSHYPPTIKDIRDMEITLQKREGFEQRPVIINWVEISDEDDLGSN